MLSLAYPGYGWSLLDITDFETLAWNSTNSTPKPSLPELLTQLDLVSPLEALTGETQPDPGRKRHVRAPRLSPSR